MLYVIFMVITKEIITKYTKNELRKESKLVTNKNKLNPMKARREDYKTERYDM